MSSAAEKSSSYYYRNKMLHRSNDSGELDVFEAARYFSGGTEAVFGYHNGGAASASISVSAGYPLRQTSSGGGRRISFDAPPMRNSLQAHHHSHLVEKHHQAAVPATMTAKEKKPHRQPSSPGGRLASFLNSLFNQAASKKKKKSKSVKETGSNAGAEEESPGGGGRRKRRSSISHFRSASATAPDSSSKPNAYSSSTASSGFRTPPPAYTIGSAPAAKSCREVRNYSDHRHHVASSGVSLSWQSVIGNHHIKSTAASHQIIDAIHDPNNNNSSYNKRNRGGLAWLDHLDEKLRFGGDKKYQLVKGSCNSKQFELSEDDKGTGKTDSHAAAEKDNDDYKVNDNIDGGAESDSSSDLFELENYDLGHYTSDLPVYETTRVEGLDRGALISSGPP